MASIIIPEDVYLKGYHYVGRFTDSNDSITSAGANTYFTLPQKGFQHGICVMYQASNLYHSYMFKFTAASANAFGIGGYASTTGNTWQARPYGAAALSDVGAFGGTIWLTNLYIDDANERVVMSWDATGTSTLDAKADFWVGKGNLVT